MTDCQQEKQTLRRRCKALSHPRPEASAAICRRILADPVYRAAKTVMAFYPMANEPDIRPVLEDALRKGKTLLLPQTDTVIHPRVVETLAELTVGKYGIHEPPADAPEAVPELVLVPAVAFDESGCRLGHGGGYYDRYLEQYAGATLGVCFEELIVAAVPRGPYDLPVERVCTERRMIGGKEGAVHG